MAKIQTTNIFALLLTLFICQMSFVEGRLMKSLNVVTINYTQSPYPTSFRKLGSLMTRSDNNETSLMKKNPQKPSLDFSQAAANKKIHPSSEPAHSLLGSSQTAKSSKIDGVGTDAQENCPGMKCQDDFRPTAPGHSPGAGHSYVTSINTPSNQLTKGHIMRKSLASSPDNFQGTNSGRSQAPGHTPKESNRESNPKTADMQNSFHSITPTPNSFFSDYEIEYKKDFQPTSAGSSPGAGHEANNKDTEMKERCLRNKCTDDFPPTAPGDSPGAGHFSVSKSDSITSNQQGKLFGVAHPHEGDKDGYRPTAPGHSPGAGHVILKEN